MIATARRGSSAPVAHDGVAQVGAVDVAHGDVELRRRPRPPRRSGSRSGGRSRRRAATRAGSARGTAVVREVVGDQLQRDRAAERDLGRGRRRPCRLRRRRRRSDTPRRRCPPPVPAYGVLYRGRRVAGDSDVELRDSSPSFRAGDQGSGASQGLKAKLGGSRNETRALARDRCGACRGSTGDGIAGRARLGHHAGRRREDERPRHRAVPPRGSRAALTITVDPSRRYQTMDGLRRVDHRLLGVACSIELDQRDPRRDDADLFVTERTVVPAPADRVPRTSSTGRHYTFDDVPPGQTDYDLRHFSHRRTTSARDPAAAAAGARAQPRPQGDGTPWSPPAWMKTNDSLVGGRLIDDPRIYQAYADYLVEVRPGLRGSRGADLRTDHPERAAEPQPLRLPRHRPARRARRSRSSTGSGPRCRRRACTRRSSATTTTGPSTPTTSPTTPPGEDPETEYPADLLLESAPRAGSAVRRTTATPATRSG